MANFSSIYEKLVDMGFANEAIDAAIKKGLYTFDMIFNELIETDRNLRVYSECNNYNKWNNMQSQPVLKLRANVYPSLFEGYSNIEDKLLDTNLLDGTDSSGLDAHLTIRGDSRSFRSPFTYEKESPENLSRATAANRAARSSRTGDRSNVLDNENLSKSSAGVVGLSKMISSTVSSSLLSTSTGGSGGGGELSNHNKMAKIQIMDLLDPSFEPITFSHPFLSSICTIRDLICWFHQSRYTINERVRLASYESDSLSCGGGSSSSNHHRLAICSDTSLSSLIELFQQLKWHLVMPSGAQSTRIFGDDFLDRTLDSLGLCPTAHLLAIISCPSQLQQQQQQWRQTSVKEETTAASVDNSPSSLTNPNSFSSSCCCSVRIEIIDLPNKPAYKLICDPSKTTLQRIAMDFSCVCGEMEMGSFTLFRVHPRQMFSYPDDYQHTLKELDLVGGGGGGDVLLHCHSNSNSSTHHLNNSSGESLLPSVPTSSTSSTSSPFIHIDQFQTETETDELVEAVSNHQQPFSGAGITLPGSLTSKSVAEIWADRQLDLILPMAYSNNNFSSSSSSHPPLSLPLSPPPPPHRKQPKSLFHFSFQLIYRSLRSFSNPICKSIRKLPNNIQQLFIRLLLEDKLLTPSLLSYFCSAGSCLSCLDLSYNLLATNEVLKCVSKCSSLQELILDNDEHTFSNEGLWHLRYLSHLRRLSLNYCSRINDWGIQVVGELPALSVLAIKYTSVTNVGLKHISLHLCSSSSSSSSQHDNNNHHHPTVPPPLRSIDLSGLTISDECLSSLSIFNQLELLNLSSTHLSNPLMFPRLCELRHLDLSHCHELSWNISHATCLAESFPKLSSLNVRGVSSTSSSSSSSTAPAAPATTANLVHITMAISHCTHVRQLDGIFCHPQMTPSLAATLSHLPLETIILTNCRHVTDLWLPVLARFSPTLTHLVLSSCLSIKGEHNSLSSNLSRLRNLSWLDLTHLENVDIDQIRQLLLGDYFPKLQVAWISLSEAEESEFRSVFSSSVHFKVNITRSMITTSSGLLLDDDG